MAQELRHENNVRENNGRKDGGKRAGIARGVKMARMDVMERKGGKIIVIKRGRKDNKKDGGKDSKNTRKVAGREGH
jgi:hypothetical protein